MLHLLIELSNDFSINNIQWTWLQPIQKSSIKFQSWTLFNECQWTINQNPKFSLLFLFPYLIFLSSFLPFIFLFFQIYLSATLAKESNLFKASAILKLLLWRDFMVLTSSSLFQPHMFEVKGQISSDSLESINTQRCLYWFNTYEMAPLPATVFL